MSIAAGLTLLGRGQAEALMESTCVITRTVIGGSIDHSTGLATDSTTTVYTGPCRLRFPSLRPEQGLVEGQQIVKARGILSVPVTGTGGIRAGDMAAVTLSPTLDPGTVVSVQIAAPFTQTHSTARRFPVEVSN